MTHVWLASRYFRSGRSEEMANHLAASSVFGDASMGRLLSDWVRRFTAIAADDGEISLDSVALSADPAWRALTRCDTRSLHERGIALSGIVGVARSHNSSVQRAPVSPIWQRAAEPLTLPPPALDLSAALSRDYGRHRSGWSAALEALQPLHVDDGIVVDGFVEHTFHVEGKTIHRSPWIGFLHNPPDIPSWYPIDQSPTRILSERAFQDSLASCRGLFTLSATVRDWWATRIDVPVESVPLPNARPHLRFTIDGFQSNPFPRIIQVGTWLRKLHAIYDLPVRKLQRTIVHQHAPYIDRLFQDERQILGLQVDESGVETLPFLDNRAFDELLSCNLVFAELYAAGANNVVVECMTRATPILVNPLGAVREYLGEDYPLYFSSRMEAAIKAEDLDLVAAAHDYLANLPQARQLSEACFLGAVAESEIYGSLPKGRPAANSHRV